MKKTENQKHKVHFAEVSTFTLEGEAGFTSYTEPGDILSCRTLTGSEKISIQNGNGVDGDPLIDIVLNKINKNELGGNSLSVANGGTGKNSLAKDTILLGNDKEEITVISKPEKDLILISTENAPKFTPLKGEGLDIKIEPTQILLKTKKINLSVKEGITINPKQNGHQLGEAISLGTNPLKLSTDGHLYIGGEPGEKGVEAQLDYKEIHLGESLFLKTKPIQVQALDGLNSPTPKVFLGETLKITASPITFQATGGILITNNQASSNSSSENQSKKTTNLLSIKLGETINLTTSPITLKTDNGIFISGGKGVTTGGTEFLLGETATLTTQPITLKINKGLFFDNKDSTEQEKKVRLAEKITLGTKSITLETQGGLYIDEKGEKLHSKTVDLADTVVLKADNIEIQTQGGLTGGGSVALGGTLTLSSKEGLKWNIIDSNTTLKANNGYVINVVKDKTIELILPKDSHIGDIVKIVGYGSDPKQPSPSGYWKIKLAKEEKIYFVKTITEGDQGFLGGKYPADCATLLCIKTDKAKEWIVTDNVGNLLTP